MKEMNIYLQIINLTNPLNSYMGLHSEREQSFPAQDAAVILDISIG